MSPARNGALTPVRLHGPSGPKWLDSKDSSRAWRSPIRRGHLDATFVSVDPEGFPQPLRRLDFADTRIDRTDYHFGFATRKSDP